MYKPLLFTAAALANPLHDDHKSFIQIVDEKLENSLENLSDKITHNSIYATLKDSVLNVKKSAQNAFESFSEDTEWDDQLMDNMLADPELFEACMDGNEEICPDISLHDVKRD